MSGIKGSDIFGIQMRGYDRRQVDEYVTRSQAQIASLEQQLARLAGENEQLRRKVNSTRQAEACQKSHTADVPDHAGDTGQAEVG